MSIIVYYMTYGGPACISFDMDEMSQALEQCQVLRNEGRSHVSMSIENPNSIGKPGVDSIVDGKTPNGEIYDWKKRRI